MDPIHPIRPAAQHPAPVEPVRRVARTREKQAGDEEASGRRAPRRPRPGAGVTADGHIDTRA
jgi:hypothetical protein